MGHGWHGHLAGVPTQHWRDPSGTHAVAHNASPGGTGVAPVHGQDAHGTRTGKRSLPMAPDRARLNSGNFGPASSAVLAAFGLAPFRKSRLSFRPTLASTKPFVGSTTRARKGFRRWGQASQC